MHTVMTTHLRKVAMIKKTIIAACASVALQANAAAPSVDLGLSTLGISISGSYQLMDSVVIRGQYNQLTFGSDFDESNINYDTDLKLSSFGLIADWYPLDNSGFRVSAGAYYNDNTLEGSGTPTSGTDFIIGDQAYTLDRLDAKVEFDNFAPYVGIGWTSNYSGEQGFIISADLGMLYQGSAKVSLDAYGTGTAIPGFNESLQKEVSRVEDELSKVNYSPLKERASNTKQPPE